MSEKKMLEGSWKIQGTDKWNGNWEWIGNFSRFLASKLLWSWEGQLESL